MSHDRPTPAERAAAKAHDHATCPRCLDPDVHGDQAPDPLEVEIDQQRSEIAEWKRVTGFEDPDALGSYLSRQTILECDAALGRVLAAAHDGRRAALAAVDRLRLELNEARAALLLAKDALEVATTPLSEDRQTVLAAFRAIEALKQ